MLEKKKEEIWIMEKEEQDSIFLHIDMKLNQEKLQVLVMI